VSLEDALRHARAATITPEEFIRRVRQHAAPLSTVHPYAYQNTEMFKALESLYAAAHPTPIPPPQPTPPVNPQSQYVVFCAENPAEALHAPQKYAVAFSADFAYREGVGAVVAQAKQAGHRTAGWCDCRVMEGTPASVGVQFVKDFGLDYFIGQAESQAEMENALSVGAKVVVGNITATGVAQLITADVAFIQEDYWNEGWARANDPRIAAYCAGIYPALWGPNIAAYQQAGRWRQGDGIYYARPDTDWQNLP